MWYDFYQQQRAFLKPFRFVATESLKLLQHPENPWRETLANKTASANAELFERITREFPKPHFNINQLTLRDSTVEIIEETVLSKPFCNLLHFRKQGYKADEPKLLIVAPLSGHHSTLLRDTVFAMLPQHDVYITDWVDARLVPLSQGGFTDDDYVDYLWEFVKHIGPGAHLLGVCQPAVPVLVLCALMNERDDPFTPATMTLMGGPLDTRINPTEVNRFATTHGLQWFRDNLISTVTSFYPGHGRRVYPGFIQLSFFVSMNFDRHVDSHVDLFFNLISDEHAKVSKHKKFYDEYLSVLDLTEEFFLETVRAVFLEFDLPLGKMRWRNNLVRPEAITKTALMTVEGEFDDISAVGQTFAAHDLCRNLPAEMKMHYQQKGVGHYGIFSGSKWRTAIAPHITNFIQRHVVCL